MRKILIALFALLLGGGGVAFAVSNVSQDRGAVRSPCAETITCPLTGEEIPAAQCPLQKGPLQKGPLQSPAATSAASGPVKSPCCKDR